MRWIATASMIVSGVILVAIVLVTTVAIFYRYFLGAPIILTEELSRVLLILLTYAGSISLPHMRVHMAIEFVYELCPPPVQRFLDNLHFLIGTAFLGLLAFSGYRLTESMGGIKLPALQIPVSYVFGAVAVACGLHAIVYAKAAFDNIVRGEDDMSVADGDETKAIL